MLLQLAQGLTGFTSYSTAYTVPATVNTGNVPVTNRSYQNVIQYFISVDEIKYLQGGKCRTLRTVLYENTQRSPKN